MSTKSWWIKIRKAVWPNYWRQRHQPLQRDSNPDPLPPSSSSSLIYALLLLFNHLNQIHFSAFLKLQTVHEDKQLLMSCGSPVSHELSSWVCCQFEYKHTLETNLCLYVVSTQSPALQTVLSRAFTVGVVMQELVTALVCPLRDTDKETHFRYFLMSAIRFENLAGCQQTFMFHRCMKRLESEKRKSSSYLQASIRRIFIVRDLQWFMERIKHNVYILELILQEPGSE